MRTVSFDRTEKTDLFQLFLKKVLPAGRFDRTEKTDLFQSTLRREQQ